MMPFAELATLTAPVDVVMPPAGAARPSQDFAGALRVIIEQAAAEGEMPVLGAVMREESGSAEAPRKADTESRVASRGKPAEQQEGEAEGGALWGQTGWVWMDAGPRGTECAARDCSGNQMKSDGGTESVDPAGSPEIPLRAPADGESETRPGFVAEGAVMPEGAVAEGGAPTGVWRRATEVPAEVSQEPASGLERRAAGRTRHNEEEPAGKLWPRPLADTRPESAQRTQEAAAEVDLEDAPGVGAPAPEGLKTLRVEAGPREAAGGRTAQVDERVRAEAGRMLRRVAMEPVASRRANGAVPDPDPVVFELRDERPAGSTGSTSREPVRQEPAVAMLREAERIAVSERRSPQASPAEPSKGRVSGAVESAETGQAAGNEEPVVFRGDAAGDGATSGGDGGREQKVVELGPARSEPAGAWVKVITEAGGDGGPGRAPVEELRTPAAPSVSEAKETDGKAAEVRAAATVTEEIEETRGPLREIRLVVEPESGKPLRLRFTENAGQVSVTARGGDADLAAALRSGLDDLREIGYTAAGGEEIAAEPGEKREFAREDGGNSPSSPGKTGADDAAREQKGRNLMRWLEAFTAQQGEGLEREGARQ